MSHHLVAFATLVAVALPNAAFAEPAVIRVFEAPVRAEPAKDAAVLQTFAEGAPVSVSEEATNGWRRIRLPDGRVGWVEESALSFPPRPAAVAVPATPAPSSTPAPPPVLLPLPAAQARIYVKDLDHLAELVKTDPEVSPMAKKLANRRNAAYAVGGLGIAVSAGLIVYGISESEKQTHDPSDPNFMKTTRGEKAFVGGVVGSIVSVIALLAVAPRRDDFLDLVNTWNTRHPDQPFTLEHGVVGH